MDLWKNDKELFSLAKDKLFTALVGDVMDKMGLLHQFLPQALKPVNPETVVIGRAMPVLEMDVFEEVSSSSHDPLLKKPFGVMFQALDDLKEDEIYICTGSSPGYALWGGLMSARATKLKAAGAIVNGFHRDTKEVLRLGFPTFSLGSYSQDQGPRGKVIDFRIPIEWEGIRICPGDIIFGDRDGVIVIPQKAEAEAFSKAIEKAMGEKLVLKGIQNNMSAVEAFQKYGIM